MISFTGRLPVPLPSKRTRRGHVSSALRGERTLPSSTSSGTPNAVIYLSAKHPVVSLMGGAIALLAAWLVPELRGILNPNSSETYTAWVVERPYIQFLLIVLVHIIVGLSFIVSVGHLFDARFRARHG